VRTFQATWQKWRTARDATLVPAARAKDYQAYVDAQKVTSPLSAQASSELQAVAKTEQVRATANARSARQTYTSARTLIIAIVLVGLVIALSGALHVTRLVVRPLKAVSAILDRVADGDLTGRAEVTGHDELGAMAESLNRATSSMQQTPRSRTWPRRLPRPPTISPGGSVPSRPTAAAPPRPSTRSPRSSPSSATIRP
jgi:methyl-accepting chemotaxis protein